MEYGYVFPIVDTFTALEAQITALDAEIHHRSKSDPTARRLMTIPGVGPIVSTAITALVPAADAQMLARKPKMLVTVALANKMARIIWALLVKGGAYRAPIMAA
jgi:transposase